MRQKKDSAWAKVSIKNKIHLFIGAIIFTIFLFSALAVFLLRFSLVDFHGIIEGNKQGGELIDALNLEMKSFELYVKEDSLERQIDLEQSMEGLRQCVMQMPYDYEAQGKESYRLTWNIRNAYEVYVEHRDKLLMQGDNIQNYITELYSIYDMQEYLMRYARLLNNENVYAGNRTYFNRYPWIVGILGLIGSTIFFSLMGLVHFSKMLNGAMVQPLEELAEASRKIADNEFFIEDIHVRNQDEVGDLVQSFNRMKNAMGQYAQAVEENRVAREKIHEQELEKVEMERQLETAKMEVLLSQMNPHFLFNTLNVIAGMANLEDADITEKMTRSLSNLLRYTVHNDLSLVPLKREIQIAEEYNYLQHMRFGARVRFQMECKVDVEEYEIPPFTFQPLIENAIIHGIAPKIEGGKIRVKVFERGENLVILVADNGVGMSKERLKMLRNGIVPKNKMPAEGEEKTGIEAHVGIAYRNILKRFQSLYSESSMEIFSKQDVGTLVRITVPAKEAKCIEC